LHWASSMKAAKPSRPKWPSPRGPGYGLSIHELAEQGSCPMAPERWCWCKSGNGRRWGGRRRRCLVVGGDSRNWFWGFGEEGAHQSRGFHGGAIRAAGSSGGGTEGQLGAPTRWSRGLTALVRILGRCRWGRRGIEEAFCGGSTTAAVFQAVQGRWSGGGGRRGGGRSTMMHSSYRRKRRWTVAAKAAGGSGGGGEAVGTAKPQRLRSESRRRGWALLFGQGHRPVGPVWFHYFLKYPKLVETCKIEMDALSFFNNSQFLHDDRLEYFEQLYQLFWL
jgi:hypothetical protein